MDTMNNTGSKFSTYKDTSNIEKAPFKQKSRNETRVKMVNTMRVSPRPVSMAENAKKRTPLE
jgi:hypothetical protein